MNKISFSEFSANNLNKAFGVLEILTGCYNSGKESLYGVATIRCNLVTCKLFDSISKTIFDLNCSLPSPYYGHCFTASVIEDESISDNKMLFISVDEKIQVEVEFSLQSD